MSWIRIQTGITTNKKTARLAREMKWGKLQTIGFLISFWSWAAENADDGQLKDISDSEIAFAVGLENIDGILEALKNSGLVDTEPLRLHDWTEYQGEFLRGKYRRNPEQYQKIVDLYRDCSVTAPGQNTERKKERKKDTEIDINKNKTPINRSADKSACGFVEFWTAYPRKIGKDAALRAWIVKKPPLPACLAALVWQTKSDQWTRDGGKYIPHPATWINQGRWQDEPTKAAATSGAAPIAGKYDNIGTEV